MMNGVFLHLSQFFQFSGDHLKQWNIRKEASGNTSPDMATPPKRQEQQDNDLNNDDDVNTQPNKLPQNE
jgi:hypothetical protein